MKSEDTAKELVELLKKRGCTISCAESCTGGMVSTAFTSVAGASAVFKGGIVAYANDIKQRFLDVNPDILRYPGAVSMECALAMAKGVSLHFQTDFGLSVTGIAGPDGGSTEKPVGTVWFGLVGDNRTISVLERFNGNRAEIRLAATQKILELFTDFVKAGLELDNPTDGGVSLS